MASPSFIERPARKTRRRFSCCTDFPLHRECSSRSSPGFPIAITLSRPITRASDTATGRTRKNSRTPSITIADIMNHFTNRSGSRATRCTCRIMAAPWVFAWPGHRTDRGSIVKDSGAQRRIGGELEDAAGLLGRSRGNESALRTNLLSLRTTLTRMSETIQRGTLRPGSVDR